MSLEQKVMDQMKDAMRSKDEAGLRALRAIKAAILIEKTSGSGKELDEEGEMKMLQKMVKQRRDSLEIFEQQGRQDLAGKEREELEIIGKFLPAQMSEEELEQEIIRIVEESGVKTLAEMGKVIAAANKQLSGKASGKAISEMVRKQLS